MANQLFITSIYFNAPVYIQFIKPKPVNKPRAWTPELNIELNQITDPRISFLAEKNIILMQPEQFKAQKQKIQITRKTYEKLLPRSYKTTLCSSGYKCPLPTCIFAHSQVALVAYNQAIQPNYKTTICQESDEECRYYKNGKCRHVHVGDLMHVLDEAGKFTDQWKFYNPPPKDEEQELINQATNAYLSGY